MNPDEQLVRRNTAEALRRRRRTRRDNLRLQVLQLIGRLTRGPAVRDAIPSQPPTQNSQLKTQNSRILVIRPDHLGDLLFATPSLHALRRALPAAHITALVGPWGEPVLAGNPDVNRCLVLSFPGFTRGRDDPAAGGAAPWQPYRLLAEWAGTLRGRFDAALVLRFDHWWGAWLAQAAGIPVRAGYGVPEVAPFLTLAVPYAGGRHEVAQNLALVAALTGDTRPAPSTWSPEHALRFRPSADDRAQAAALAPGDGWVAIHPGAGAAVKRWRTDAWAAVAAALVAERGLRVVLTGGAGEHALCAEIAARVPGAVNAAGQTARLGVLAALFARCRLALGPDSGPLHLAVAMGVPTLHLYGPADALAFGPWGAPGRHHVVTLGMGCAPCGVLAWDDELARHPCVRAIPVEAVLTRYRMAVAQNG
jgi:ADP-heptose:LPS heptosyltransferase